MWVARPSKQRAAAGLVTHSRLPASQPPAIQPDSKAHVCLLLSSSTAACSRAAATSRSSCRAASIAVAVLDVAAASASTSLLLSLQHE